MLLFGFDGNTLVDVGDTVGIDAAALLDFLLCNVGRLGYITSARTDGALACRVNLGGTTADLSLVVTLFFGGSIFALEFALSALRRAGFFRGLFGVVFEDWDLAAVATASIDVAMSIYLSEDVFRGLCQASVDVQYMAMAIAIPCGALDIQARS